MLNRSGQVKRIGNRYFVFCDSYFSYSAQLFIMNYPSLNDQYLIIIYRVLKFLFRTKKESPQTSSDSFSPVNSSKTAAPSLITTFKRSRPFTLFSDLEEECKFLSKPSLEKPSPSKLRPPTLLKMSRLKFRYEIKC